MNEKKVIAVIVEGPSDENAIGGILKEYFSSEEVQFAVVHGDITSSDMTAVDNVVTKIENLIDGIRTKYGYRIYFNSCNLEHVLYGVLKDYSDEEKEEMSDDFAEKYEGKVNDFISFISDETLAVLGTYKATWRFIEKEKHSLERHSNMHLIFVK